MDLGNSATTKVLLESNANEDVLIPLNSKDRLAVLDQLDILDAPSDRVFQSLTQLANKLLGTPVSLISLVTNDRQYFVSSDGLGEPWASRQETGLSHSFCQHVVSRDMPLVIHDAKTHPLVCDNLAISDLNVQAYLGVPLVYEDGTLLGAFCIIDDKPRRWTTDELATVKKLASTAANELAIRRSAKLKQNQLEARLRHAQKMELLGNFASGIAHDFNNLLSTIQLYSDLLESDLDSKDSGMSSVQNIQLAINSAKNLVQQLLNWSQTADEEFKPLSLCRIVEQTLPLIAIALPSTIVIEEQLDDSVGLILANANQIQQILMNLCANSEYSMREKGGTLKIAVSDVELNEEAAQQLDLSCGRFVKLAVRDEGCGIPPEILLRIQDPYFTTKPKGEGTGLGLWTVLGIVESHGARITTESSARQGTTIEIYFPLTSPQKSFDKN